MNDSEILNKLESIYNSLKIDYGHFIDEFPEQYMTCKYLTGDEKVLEIGGNIGRNSMVISKILKDDRNLVVLETCDEYLVKLYHNRNMNGLNFNVEPSAISNVKLAQKMHVTKPMEVLEDGWFFVNTIKYEDLLKKYNLQFDTLVLDCEGAIYYILQETPQILNGITKIIIENDYYTFSHMDVVNKIFMDHGFKSVYTENANIPWFPDPFYQVWMR